MTATFEVFKVEENRIVHTIMEDPKDPDSKIKELVPGESKTTLFFRRDDGKTFALAVSWEAAKFFLNEI